MTRRLSMTSSVSRVEERIVRSCLHGRGIGARLCHDQKARPRCPFRGAERAWRRAKPIDTSFMFIASCALIFPARFAVANRRSEFDDEHGQWHENPPKNLPVCATLYFQESPFFRVPRARVYLRIF